MNAAMTIGTNSPWPDLPFAAWRETCDTLLLWTQIVGKVRIACTPLINHWWNATFDVTSRGLAAPAMAYRGRTSTSRSISLNTGSTSRRATAAPKRLRSNP